MANPQTPVIDIVKGTPDIQHVYGVFNGKEFVEDTSAGFPMLKYKVRTSDGLVIALFDAEKVPIDKTPDVYECKHCEVWLPRDDVYFDNRCESICFPCLAEQHRRRNSSPRKA